MYNGAQYFYITNQLGDVVGIANAQGEPIAAYSYDEWGNPIETVTRNDTEEQNKIAEINPLRYRGYYYDTETGYYYLQSRYYNPEWGRFISPDSFGYIDNSTRLGFNAYIYCVNNPIMYTDPTGTEEESNQNITEQSKSVVQIVSSLLFSFGVLRWIIEAPVLGEAIETLSGTIPEIIGTVLMLMQSVTAIIWDYFSDLATRTINTLSDWIFTFFDYLFETMYGNVWGLYTFTADYQETMSNEIFNIGQKYALILVNAISLVIDFIPVSPELLFIKNFINNFTTTVVDFVMQGVFLLQNGIVIF